MHGCGHLRNANLLKNVELKNFRDLDCIGDDWVSYQGEFKEGLFNGYGIWTFKNGDRFHGIFLQGRAHGKGYIINYLYIHISTYYIKN